MLTVISPAKRLDWSETGLATTVPEFQREANMLAARARGLSLRDLHRLMDLSDDLARLNRDRFRAFTNEPDGKALRPAVMAFAGDTYQGLDARSLDVEALEYSQRHLRILSGLYGVLRPLDGIQPYRLEMGSRLANRRGRNLYDFWRDLPARALNSAAEAAGTDVLINCASQEYFGAVDGKRLSLRVIEPVFLEDRPGGPKVISFFAKQARGALARFVIDNRSRDPGDLAGFDRGGYRFDADASRDGRPVFIRPADHSFNEAS